MPYIEKPDTYTRVIEKLVLDLGPFSPDSLTVGGSGTPPFSVGHLDPECRHQRLPEPMVKGMPALVRHCEDCVPENDRSDWSALAVITAQVAQAHLGKDDFDQYNFTDDPGFFTDQMTNYMTFGLIPEESPSAWSGTSTPCRT